MKKLILLIPISIFFLSCEQTQTSKTEEVKIEVQTDSIPELEIDSVDDIEIVEYQLPRDFSLYSDWYDYLLENYDTISASNKIIGESAHGGKDVCHFDQRFELGITFSYGGCGEGGASESIVFPGFTKEELYEIINSKFFTEDNTWNEDSTSYEADGAGCYYSIEERNDSLFVSTYCGC